MSNVFITYQVWNDALTRSEENGDLTYIIKCKPAKILAYKFVVHSLFTLR